MYWQILIIKHRLEAHRQVVRHIKILEMCINVSIDNLKGIYSSGNDDTQIAVTTIGVTQILQIGSRITAIKLIFRHTIRVITWVLIKIITQVVCQLIAFEASCVPYLQ